MSLHDLTKRAITGQRTAEGVKGIGPEEDSFDHFEDYIKRKVMLQMLSYL